ncbi:AMP-dependent synthetase/ligase domain-containing protein OS=Streptomyces microflavus OX=1919 GN=Smic_84030 PE=4 SV=1 [Streptomyces microflavus]
MTPAHIHVVAEMPVNGNGKTDRGALRDRLRAGL